MRRGASRRLSGLNPIECILGASVYRYLAAAFTLRLFSLTDTSRRVYRLLSETVGVKSRIQKGLPDSYLDNAVNLIRFLRKIPRPISKMRILEIGTGWAHFYGLLIRLLYDVEVVLEDIADVRQLASLKKYFNDFGKVMGTRLELEPEQIEHANKLLDVIQSAELFEDIYAGLGMTYVIDPSRVLASFPSNHYDLIVGFDVLEHVPKKDVPTLLDNLERINKPDGFQIHQIVISDHLVQYDPGVSPKNYLRYSNRTWNRFFDNKVQHMNRIQATDRRRLFGERKETILSEQVSKVAVKGRKISADFRHLSKADWETAVLLMLLRKEI